MKMRISHQSVYKIKKDKVFDSVNSYKELNDAIRTYGESLGIEEYNNAVGNCFEVFTQFFCMKYGNTPLLRILNISDTSDDPYNQGYDFTFTDFDGMSGQIQSKWRSNPKHQFTLSELSANSAIASDMGIGKDNNILFTNLDDVDELFHYTYKTARNKRRVIGRNSQEEFILRDNNFWNEFRDCIKKSAKYKYEDPYHPRDIQSWIMNGVNKDGIQYEGTESVISGKYHRGKVEASTGAGKTLCQFYNIDRSFKVYNKNLAVMVAPTISLITQTFNEFCMWKMFGDNNGQSNVSCLIIMSGSIPKHDDQIVDLKVDLNINNCIDFISDRVSKGRKVVVFTTMKSQDLKYSNIIDSLKEKSIRVGLEIVDEYHNIISSSGSRKDQLETAEFLRNSEERTDGALFYSASNKHGHILSSFNEELFGKLLCKVTRNDLRIRGYVVPKLVFKIVRVNPKKNDAESRRSASRVKLDLDKAQSEAVSIVSAYKDLKNYYDDPNMITFGDHVEGCRYISINEEVKNNLSGTKIHFMASETKNSDREIIIDTIKNSGGNILNQHSVAKEGINIKNLHASIIGRTMAIISLQQAIGRSDRALQEDTINLEKGLISLDSPIGWKKYYNVIYIIVDSDDSFKNRVKEIVGYLLGEGIPESEWDITELEDDGKGGSDYESPDFSPDVPTSFSFNKKKFQEMIQQVKIELIEEDNSIKEAIENEMEREKINSTPWIELMESKRI
jgi:superfamily II DNA or RNA helicase